MAAGGDPPESSLYALPLFLQDRWLGGIVLEVPSSFDDSDRRFLDALASGMAVALDRARLLERERERQREEKERLEAEVTDLRRVVHGSRIAYRSAAMESLLATARKIARTDTTVLITGESGTGKEMFAHTLHELSGRNEKPLVVVDCGAIAPTLIESELFGHEKGAFTGAHTRKPGKLARADGGTVFLDEIGDLPLDLQSKLLRFVQEKQFTPVGGVEVRKVDVRIIAATNVDLRAKVAEGGFREDLFHRLNVIRLHVPPLRERPDDILHLATIFLQQFAALYRRPAHHFTERATAALSAYPWPGNVRELQNLVMTSVLFCDGAEVDVEDLQGFQAALAAPRRRRSGARVTASVTHALRGRAGTGGAAGDPATRLREALAREVAAAVAGGAAGLVPLGKWLAEDLVLAADRMAAGAVRRGRRAARVGGHDVSPPIEERDRAADVRHRASLGDVERRRVAPRGLHPGAAPGHRRLPVGRGGAARRDRIRRAGRRPEGGRPARGHRANPPPPPGGTPAPDLSFGAPELWRHPLFSRRKRVRTSYTCHLTD